MARRIGRLARLPPKWAPPRAGNAHLAKAGLQPHRLRRYVSSNDPEFEEKAADIIGLYLKPPVNAAVFCVDSEKCHSSIG
jgi:hypothetical protein